MTSENLQLYYNLVKICDELDLNAITLSKMIEFDNIELVSNVLNKKSMPTLAMLDKMVSHLGINPVWLYSMSYPIGFTKFGLSESSMFDNKPFTRIYPRPINQSLSHYCENTNIKHIMLVFEDFKESGNNPKVAIILEKDYVYEIISVFDFFDTDDFKTKNGLLDMDSIIDTTAVGSPFNILVQTLSTANFKEMLSNNHHIGNFGAKNRLADKMADRVVRFAFEPNEEIAHQFKMDIMDCGSEFLDKINFLRNFIKSSRQD